MASEYTALRDNLIKKASGSEAEMKEVEVKLQELLVQLQKASDDILHRMSTFSDHTDHVRKIIALIKRMRKAFAANRLNELEKQRKELDKKIDSLDENILKLYDNIKIDKSEERLVIRLENEIGVDAARLKDLTIRRCKVHESESAMFYGVPKKKLEAMVDDEKKAILAAAKTKALTAVVIDIISRMDSYLDRLSVFVGKERALLERLKEKDSRKSLDMGPTGKMGVESQLSAVLRQINLLLREMKETVVDPFFRLVEREVNGIDEAMELINSKKTSVFGRFFGRSKKITYNDIRKAMYRFSEPEEYHTFFSVLKSRPELLDENAGKRLDMLFKLGWDNLVQLKSFAYKDGLTSLHNKRYFERHVSSLIEDGKEFSIFMVDIDHFKGFNDEFGHLVGDKVLVAVANVLKASTRTTDLVCRWGGEEMVVLFPPRTSMDVAGKVCERIRQNVQNEKLTDAEDKPIRSVTISGGLVHVDAGVLQQAFEKTNPLEVKKEIFEQADALLYQAKETGRNRIYKKEFVVPDKW
ncbi:diguanylate cyclase [Nanoarchaeota archaeon]